MILRYGFFVPGIILHTVPRQGLGFRRKPCYTKKMKPNPKPKPPKPDPNDRKTWYKLDLSAIVYPTLQRRDYSSVYRLSFILKEPIDPELMQQAVDLALPRFPIYKTSIRKGLFWRYMEPNHRPGPFVMEDINNPCMPMPFKANNRYLLRFYYHKSRISMEAHHCLGDGSGGMCVFATVIAVYLRLRGYEITCSGFVRDISEQPDPGELEDAYMKYASSSTPARAPRATGKTYCFHGTKEPFYTLNIIDGIAKAKEVHTVAAKYQATVTEYLNAVLLYALLQKQKTESPRHPKPVRLAMPVNLRRFYPSETLRNFISMIHPGIDPGLGEFTFEEIVSHVHHYMRYHINQKFLGSYITNYAAIQRPPWVRIIPLFIKDFVVSSYYARVQDRNSSAGLTNMGVLKLPDDMAPHIERVDIYMGQPFSSRTNCAIISFGEYLTINFASSIVETDVERYFFRKLVEDGIQVLIQTNRKESQASMTKGASCPTV